MRSFETIADFVAAEGEELGTTDWITIDQERIDLFADATDDHQWIHVDQERAKDGPFGITIAHGFLTLSIVPLLSHQLYEIEKLSMGINYGLDKVRFPAPVPSGSRVRGSSQIVSVKQLDGGAQAVLRTTIEIEGGSKPACVAETVVRYFE